MSWREAPSAPQSHAVGAARLNIKIPSYRYRNFHYKDKTISNAIPGKTAFILRRAGVHKPEYEAQPVAF